MFPQALAVGDFDQTVFSVPSGFSVRARAFQGARMSISMRTLKIPLEPGSTRNVGSETSGGRQFSFPSQPAPAQSGGLSGVPAAQVVSSIPIV